MGNKNSKPTHKRRKQHGCLKRDHCCQCECIESIKDWNVIDRVSPSFFEWNFSKQHQESLETILKQYNLLILMDTFIAYLLDVTPKSTDSYGIYCHSNIWKHKLKICDQWLKKRNLSDPIKVVLLGSGGSGKRSLTHRWIHEGFSVEYDPTIEDTEQKTFQFTFDQQQTDLNEITFSVRDRIMDCDDYVGAYSEALQQGDMFFICFCSPYYFTANGVPQIIHTICNIREEDLNSPGIILVQCKCDIRNEDYDASNIYWMQMKEIIQEYNLPLVQTSAKENINVELLFKLSVHEYWVQLMHQ